MKISAIIQKKLASIRINTRKYYKHKCSLVTKKSSISEWHDYRNTFWKYSCCFGVIVLFWIPITRTINQPLLTIWRSVKPFPSLPTPDFHWILVSYQQMPFSITSLSLPHTFTRPAIYSITYPVVVAMRSNDQERTGTKRHTLREDLINSSFFVSVSLNPLLKHVRIFNHIMRSLCWLRDE